MTKEERREAWIMCGEIRGIWILQGACGNVCGYFVPHGISEDASTAEFLAAMCSAGAGFYHVSAYVEEAKRWGIEVRLPSVNRSRMEYTAEREEDEANSIAGPAPTKAMRIGLMQVKGLRVETIVAIVRAREAEGAFRSLEDFLARVPVERDEIEALIKCGAFDDVCDMTRAAMLWQWNLLQAGGRAKPFPHLQTQEHSKESLCHKNQERAGKPGPYTGNTEPAGSRRYWRRTCCCRDGGGGCDWDGAEGD